MNSPFREKGAEAFIKTTSNHRYASELEIRAVEDGLTDKRGHHKTDEEVDELKGLHMENARLKRQLEEKDMLAELLKSARIRKDVRLGKLRYSSKFMTVKFFMKQNSGVSLGCANSLKYQKLLTINGCIGRFQNKKWKISG